MALSRRLLRSMNRPQEPTAGGLAMADWAARKGIASPVLPTAAPERRRRKQCALPMEILLLLDGRARSCRGPLDAAARYPPTQVASPPPAPGPRGHFDAAPAACTHPRGPPARTCGATRAAFCGGRMRVLVRVRVRWAARCAATGLLRRSDAPWRQGSPEETCGKTTRDSTVLTRAALAPGRSGAIRPTLDASRAARQMITSDLT
eukprot:scaffold3605_cov430-Prasinococcus_capsulatus_cf.AAC.13